MKKQCNFIHPYIPNSVPEVKAQMLKEIGAKDIEELYEDIPDRSVVHKIDDIPLDDPKKWAITWRS